MLNAITQNNNNYNNNHKFNKINSTLYSSWFWPFFNGSHLAQQPSNCFMMRLGHFGIFVIFRNFIKENGIAIASKQNIFNSGRKYTINLAISCVYLQIS